MHVAISGHPNKELRSIPNHELYSHVSQNIRYIKIRYNLIQMRCNLNQRASTHVDNMLKHNI